MKSLAYSYLRISTDLQQKGHGRKRQLEASRAYADANGLELAEDGELEDIGVSAFKGANAREGALGRFLEAVRSGRIKPGSYLIVESLDRLSREQVLVAQSLFLSIIQAGINLVTLTDNRVYRAGTTDLGDLIMSLVIMSRAHEESQTKSLRLSAAWKNKRAAASTLKPMTKWCPAWLRLSDDRSGYAPIPDRVEVVRRIFNDSANGIGIYKIAHRLNQSNTPTFNDSDGWHQSYIAKILANRAVIGEFQPGVRLEGKRTSEGESIKNYFPAIINEELFYRARQAKSQRQRNGAGRKGTGFSNLFSGLASCAYCGASMTYDNKGSGPKGNRYLVCTNSKRRLGCQGKRWRYSDFEASFLAFVSEIELAALIDSDGGQGEQKQAALKLSSLEGELSSVTALMDKTYQLLESGAPPDFVSSKLRELQLRKDELAAGLTQARATLEKLRSGRERLSQNRDEIKGLLQRLQNANQRDVFELRAKIAAHLRSMISTLSVAPQGGQPRLAQIANKTREAFGNEAMHVADYIARRALAPEQSLRYFSVGFRDGRVRIVLPDAKDAFKYEQQIIASASTHPVYDRSGTA
ncbi:recombinase family protein [Bradyrhizobium sp. BRP56]|nr:recombinase family protein [Bradyrhizobium sp. BRP56]